VIGLLVFGYLYQSSKHEKAEFSSESSYFALMAIGMVVFALGYSIFLTNSQVGFTPTGVKNRTAIAAAVGVAILYSSVIAWLSWILPSRRLGRFLLPLLISVLSVSGFLINNTIARFWTAASRQQQKVIASVRQEFPTLPSQTTVILDGQCPYTGPGIVFECYWDVGGMLKTYYHDTSLRGDIVRRNIQIEEEGLYTSIYGERQFYPYSDKLVLLDLGQNRTYPLTNAGDAQRYFQVIHPDYKGKCEGDEGYGSSIF